MATKTFSLADTSHSEGTKLVTSAQVLNTYDTDVRADATTASFSITLPSPVRGKIYSLKKIDSTVNTVTISHPSATIDGQSSYLLRNQYEAVRLTSDGTNYFVSVNETDRDSLRSVATSQILTNADDIVLADATSAALTLTLPAPLVGKKITIKKTDSTANKVTIQTPSGTLDGLSSKSLVFYNDFAQVVSDGTNYHVISTSPVVVSSEAELSAALTAYTATGGIIFVGGNFSLTGSYTIPSNVTLSGYGQYSTITLTGSSTLTMGTDSEMRDLRINTTRTTGSLVEVANSRSIIHKVNFVVTPTTTVTCVRVTGSGNRIILSRFSGVVGFTAVGITYVSGTQNVDRDCVFY
jgi:hypothetical protein